MRGEGLYHITSLIYRRVAEGLSRLLHFNYYCEPRVRLLMPFLLPNGYSLWVALEILAAWHHWPVDGGFYPEFDGRLSTVIAAAIILTDEEGNEIPHDMDVQQLITQI